MPVPMRLRMPSASFITRLISTPLWVASKKLTGRRSTRACTRRRSSVIARWAATEITWESVNELAACSSVATPTAIAIGVSRSRRCFPRTSSMMYLVEPGSTRPAKRLTSIRARPIASERRWAHISFRVSAHAAL